MTIFVFFYVIYESTNVTFTSPWFLTFLHLSINLLNTEKREGLEVLPNCPPLIYVTATEQLNMSCLNQLHSETSRVFKFR